MALPTSAELSAISLGASQIDSHNMTFKNVNLAVANTMGELTGSYNTPAAAILISAMQDWHAKLTSITAQFDDVVATLQANMAMYQSAMEQGTTSANNVLSAISSGGASATNW